MNDVYKIFAYNDKEFRIYDDIKQLQNEKFDYNVYYIAKIVEKHLKLKEKVVKK